jgi:hypothetical protein
VPARITAGVSIAFGKYEYIIEAATKLTMAPITA